MQTSLLSPRIPIPSARSRSFQGYIRKRNPKELPLCPACLGDFSPSLSLQVLLCGRFRACCPLSAWVGKNCPLCPCSSPFSREQSRPLCSFTPFLAFLNRTDVRRPTPLKRGLVGVSAGGKASPFKPLSLSRRWKAWLSRCRAFLSNRSLSNITLFCSRFKDLLSLMGLSVGGSCRDSSSEREGAGPVGSRVGGCRALASSAKGIKNLPEHFRNICSQNYQQPFPSFTRAPDRRKSRS